jgi:hypothetical protein
MYTNALPTEQIAPLASIDPVSTAVTVVSGWVSVKNFHSYLALIDVGAFGAGATVDAKLQQAQDNAGTGAKNLTNGTTGTIKQITQLVAAGGPNRMALICARISDLDQVNNFNFIQLSITVGVAASLVAGYLFGTVPRFEPIFDANANPPYNNAAANIAQVVP